MKNKTTKALLPLLILTILMSAFASAEMIIQTYQVDYGFMMKTTPVSSHELCSCESYTDYFIVENTGTYASTYSLTVESDYVTLSATTFELLPGESETVYMFIQGPCDKNVDEQIIVSVTDLFQNTQQLIKGLKVGKCQNLEAELRTDVEESVNPCTPVSYDITVKNTGVFTENYHIEFGGNKYEDYFDLPYQDMMIEAGGQGTVSATMTPACSISGELVIPFSVEAVQNELIATLEHELSINNNYDFEVISGVAEVCGLQETNIPILINNKANFDNSYSITLDAPKNFALDREEMNVSSGAGEIFFIKAQPSTKQIGEHNLTVTVTGEVGGQIAETTAQIIVLDCHSVSVNIDLQEDIYDCSGQYSYPIVVKNTGLVSADIRLDVYGSEYITATESNFALAPGEEKTTAMYANLPPAHALEKDIKVVASVLGVEDVTAEDTINVEFIDEQACHAVELLDNKVLMNFDEEEVMLTMKHVGLASARYDLSYDGEGFALEDDDERLNPGEEEKVILEKINDSEERVYKGTLHVVTTSEDEERLLTYDLPVTINYHKESIFEKGKDYFSAKPCQFVTSILIILLIVGLLIVIIRPDRPRSRGIPLLMILLGLWLLIAVIFIGIFGVPTLYEPVGKSDNPLVIIMGEDDTYALNLTGFFVDEDGDTLDYLVSEMDNVSVTISNGTAYIVPDTDFFGSRRFRITAFDGKGGATESPRMNLEILDRPEYTGFTWFAHFCGYINVVLLLLVFLVASVLFRPRIRPPKREKAVKEEKKETKAQKAEKKSVAKKPATKKTASKKKTATKKKASKKKAPAKKPSLPSKKSSKN